MQEAAYRIVQEALTNVVRHAGASRADVVLAAPSAGPDSGRLTVTVDDDGRGAAGAPEGNGVTGMRERAAALGGTVEFVPLEPGWRVRAVLPLIDVPATRARDSAYPPGAYDPARDLRASPNWLRGSGAPKKQMIRILIADDQTLIRAPGSGHS